MRHICVFCGSQLGTNGLYQQAAAELGQLLVQRRYGLVYGGGHVGLMGVIADAVLQARMAAAKDPEGEALARTIASIARATAPELAAE